MRTGRAHRHRVCQRSSAHGVHPQQDHSWQKLETRRVPLHRYFGYNGHHPGLCSNGTVRMTKGPCGPVIDHVRLFRIDHRLNQKEVCRVGDFEDAIEKLEDDYERSNSWFPRDKDGSKGSDKEQDLDDKEKKDWVAKYGK